MKTSNFPLRLIEKDEGLADQLFNLAASSFPGQSPWTKKQFADILKQKFIFVIGAYAGENLVGFLCGSLNNFEAEVYNICVEKNFRRKGIAKQMLGHLVKMMAKQKVSYLFLEVRKSNIGAIHLYQNFGFKYLTVRKDYYKNPQEDAYLLAYNLPLAERSEEEFYENTCY